jgi:hypothetical protein
MTPAGTVSCGEDDIIHDDFYNLIILNKPLVCQGN